MKSSLIAFGCILLGAVACTAPQGKKLARNTDGLDPVATGPSVPLTKAANLSLGEKGAMVNITKNGTVTVTLDSTQVDSYRWRLSEVPDPTVLKVVSQEYTPPAGGVGRGTETWVFQAIGPGDVEVKMWYGNLLNTSVSHKPNFDFVASVSEHEQPEKKTTSVKKTKKSPKEA